MEVCTLVTVCHVCTDAYRLRTGMHPSRYKLKMGFMHLPSEYHSLAKTSLNMLRALKISLRHRRVGYHLFLSPGKTQNLKCDFYWLGLIL